MKKLIVAFVLCLPLQVTAEQITLKDGSTINGEVISLTSGSYQVRTESLGVITLLKSQVRSISEASAASSAQELGAAKSAMDSIQSTISSDPGIMASILQLQSDPDMQAVLSDPEIMRAVQSFDLEALRNNPKIQQLMRNAKIRRIQGEVQ